MLTTCSDLPDSDYTSMLTASCRWALWLLLVTGCSSGSALNAAGRRDTGNSEDIVGSGESQGLGGSGGMGGTGGAVENEGVFGMPCTTDRDCPTNAICCDGSSESCDGTRLPSGDGINPGEFVVSADGLTVMDTITGLIWQREGSSLRAGCSGDVGAECTWSEAQAYCETLMLGGVSGWRLPAWKELFTLGNHTGDMATSEDNSAFLNTVENYWTSSVVPQGNPVGPYGELYVALFTGQPEYCGDDYHRVLCVRGARCYPKTRFVVLDRGLVRDALTGLVWEQQPNTEAMTWSDAQSYCLSLGSGFRLPTLKELDSLVDPTQISGPTLDTTAFPDAGDQRYWTSTPYTGIYVDSSGDAFFGDFSLPGSNYCAWVDMLWARLDANLMVRCVR
jgi:hypothetical protein